MVALGSSVAGPGALELREKVGGVRSKREAEEEREREI